MTTTTPTPSGDRRKSRKGLLGLVAIGTAGALVAGLGFAYFSDGFAFGGGAQAGTLDLTGDVTIQHKDAANTVLETLDEGGEVANFNPGDQLVFTANVSNDGSKSAWLRSTIDVTGDLYPTYVTVTSSNPAMVAGNAVLNGNTARYGDDAETETAGADSHTQVYTVTFNANAPNAAQGLDVGATVNVEAVQFRNNTDPVSWANIDSNFSTQVVGAAPATPAAPEEG